MSVFNKIPLLPADPVFKIPAAFARDPRPEKINLAIGVYRDENGRPLVLDSIRQAQHRLINEETNKDYFPIEGNPALPPLILNLFGKDVKTHLQHAVIVQTVGGTSALRLGADFLKDCSSPYVYMPDPSWPNHPLIFQRSGWTSRVYPYVDPSRSHVLFARICQTLEEAPPNSTILLQGSCHNPTGIDLTLEQWTVISDIILKRQLIPFFDIAYQGFGQSFEGDIAAFNLFIKAGHEALLAYSFSKNMGLYGERCGFLLAATHNQETRQKVQSHLSQIVRAQYSNPPLHSGRLLATVLSSAELSELWQKELEHMRDRVKSMRRAFAEALQRENAELDFSYLIDQQGLFSQMALDEKSVQKLQRESAIYLLENGRLNFAGLNQNNLAQVVKALTTIFKESK